MNFANRFNPLAHPRDPTYAEHVSSERPADAPPLDDLAERAARVRAMLARWQAEDTTDEPDWDVEDVEPMRLDPKPTHHHE